MGPVISELIDSTGHVVVDPTAIGRPAGLLDPDQERAFFRCRLRRLRQAGALEAVVEDSGGVGVLVRDRAPHSELAGVALGRIEQLVVPKAWLTLDGGNDTRSQQALVDSTRALERVRGALRERYAMVDALVDHPALVLAGADTGMTLCGGNETWIGSLGDRPPRDANTDEGITVGIAGPEDRPELLSCIDRSYAGYRSHWQNDPKLDLSSSAGPYVADARVHIDAGRDVVVARDEDGTIVAFATLDPHGELNEVLGRLAAYETGLVGVTPESRGRRLAEAVLAGAFDRLDELRVENVVYGVSTANPSAKRVLARLGFLRPCRELWRLHWWLR